MKNIRKCHDGQKEAAPDLQLVVQENGPSIGRGLKEDVEGLDDENTKIAIHVSLSAAILATVK